MAASVTELLCILVDNNFQHTIGGAFVVEVPSDGLIVHLKKQIKEERQNLLALIDAADLEVWRLRKPQRSVEIKRNISNFKCLGEVLRNEDEGDDEVAWLVQEDEEILSHFSGLPKNAISVLVWVPPPSKIGDDITGECSIHPPYASLSCLAYTSSFKPPLPSRDVVGQNRAQEDEAVQVMKYIHDTPYSRLAPSDTAKGSEFRRLQNDPERRILNDRPYKDVQITPIALLYSPFGEFLDHIRNPPTISDGVHLKKLQAAVEDFSFLMCQHYTNEEGRRRKVLKALNAIFECYLPYHLTTIIPSLLSGSRSSDGHAEGPAGVLEVVVEFKNELGIGQTDPEVQITGYYLQSLREESFGPHKALYERFLFPALGISLMGKGHKHYLF
jgi:hypothetical protein